VQFTTAEIALAVTATTVSMGLLAAFFILITLRQYRLNAQRQLRLLDAVLEAQDNERRRIAEDMHDGLGQLLAATKLQTDALRHARPEMVDERIKTIKETLDHASAEVRTIVHDLMPRKLERDGLWHAIEELGKAVGAGEQLRVIVETGDASIRYNPRAELNLYRIVQELVTNAVRHANATEIRIDVRNTAQRLFITVADNGKGFHAEQSADGGNGLRNVRSRTAWLRGSVTREPNTSGGTRFVLIFETTYLQESA